MTYLPDNNATLAFANQVVLEEASDKEKEK